MSTPAQPTVPGPAHDPPTPPAKRARPHADAFWALDEAALLRRVESRASGLSRDEAEARLARHGENRLRPAHRGAVWTAVASQARNPLLWLLLVAASISAALGEVTDALVVIAILVLGSVISMLQEARAGRALERLRDRTALRSRVLRDGEEREIAATDIVPGDVVVLAAGTLVPADGVLLEARDLFAMEAALTGEPFPVEKEPGPTPADAPLAARKNAVHMGTSIRSGTGRAVIVETGTRTSFGHVATRLAAHPPETEFARGLRRFGLLLLSTMVVLVFVVFMASALRDHPAIEALLFAVALAVGLAPEMLPAILATMLSRGARKMAQRGVLVRRLAAIENLGNMDVLCTDKTGTLTEGEIRMESAIDVGGASSPRVLELARINAALQSGLPNPLDRAILAEGAGTVPPKLDEIPFDFTRKRLSVLVDEGGPLLVTKGAFEHVLEVCRDVREGDRVRALDDALRDALRARVTDFGRRGVRVIAVATRAWPSTSAGNEAEAELVLEGLCTFFDPPKEGAREAIAALCDLHVGVKIVSGDHHAVVTHLAEQLGLATHRIVTGEELEGLREEALWHLVRVADLFAEVDPGQKERILVALRRTGHVVGFMGDGINDAPAMHAADVGISVEGATDVAREAADFVLLDRDLGRVRDGVMVGRTTFANTLKYVLTTESANLGNMLSMAAASLFLPFLPLLAHQVLLNNFLSDIPSATLSADRVDPELAVAPRRWDIRFIRRFMIVFGLLSAIFDGVTFVLLRTVFHAGAAEFRTAWFMESLLTELFVLLSLRTRRPLWRSRPHAALLGSTLVVALVTCALPLSPLRGVLAFVSLPPALWLAVLAIAATYVLSVELLKRPLLSRIEASRPARPER